MQVTPLSFNLVLPPIFYNQPKHIFVLNRTLFSQTLTIVPHLFLHGFSKMVYEHFLGCFIPENPSLGFLELFQVTTIVIHVYIPRLVALVLGANRLMAMAKDNGNLHPITMGEVFFQLINRSIIL
jgi:hypothetical protein